MEENKVLAMLSKLEENEKIRPESVVSTLEWYLNVRKLQADGDHIKAGQIVSEKRVLYPYLEYQFGVMQRGKDKTLLLEPRWSVEEIKELIECLKVMEV